jgi:hypothetical protein
VAVHLEKESFIFIFLGSNNETFIIKDFKKFWYQKKCRRELNMPWEIKTKKSYRNRLNNVDPLLVN